MSELSDYKRLVVEPRERRQDQIISKQAARIREIQEAEPRKLAIEEAIKAISSIDQFANCDYLGLMDPETGARECSLERRGTCLCQERTEAIEKAVDKLKAMFR